MSSVSGFRNVINEWRTETTADVRIISFAKSLVIWSSCRHSRRLYCGTSTWIRNGRRWSRRCSHRISTAVMWWGDSALVRQTAEVSVTRKMKCVNEATEAHQRSNDKKICVISYLLSAIRDSVRVVALHGVEWWIGDHKNGMVGFRQDKAQPLSTPNSTVSPSM
jgi:hypothetical protein